MSLLTERRKKRLPCADRSKWATQKREAVRVTSARTHAHTEPWSLGILLFFLSQKFKKALDFHQALAENSNISNSL
ncbi:MAG: hypothetical protein DMG06_17785 [Acidobacteria bacterium]|nr:MAG: hypothetical protein DMG06_17785 [Acidobacteriota bacterium]